MRIQTKYFGEVEIEENKIIHFHKGLMGFEEYKDFTIIYDVENKGSKISWLQCATEANIALPIMNPLDVVSDYNPFIAEASLNQLEGLSEENMAVFTVVTVPADVKKMTINLKAPIIINSDTTQAIQVIADNKEYSVRNNLYELLVHKEESHACIN